MRDGWKSAARWRQLALASALGLWGTTAVRAEVVLQYFEGRWDTIERRMPDIFMSGYSGLWIPPASRADSGNHSVGYDVFDRFDLGSEGNETLYGTESSLRYMVNQANRAGILVNLDIIYNHNGFSDGYRGDRAGQPPCQLRWAVGQGGYPGFVMSGRDLGPEYPFDMEFRHICPSEEFPSPSCEDDPLNCRISGLIDIRHETDFQFIRHPVHHGDPENIPFQEHRVSEQNRRFYPDSNLEPYDDGVYPFNLADPMAGEPYTENVSDMLMRHTQWLTEVIGIDGFRLDAFKHMPHQWFEDNFDFIVHQRACDFWGRPRTPFSFVESIEGEIGALATAHRRDGYGNRAPLDFPLKFAMNNNLGNPNGSLANLLWQTADSLDGNAQNGRASVLFVQSHDTGFIGDPPPLQNAAYAHILSRHGTAIVYYNAEEFLDALGPRDFPNRQSRGDALGQYGDIMTRLVDVKNNFVSHRDGNSFRSMWEDNDYIAYELDNTLVAGITDRDDSGTGGNGYETRTVDNFGFRNMTLTEITGNASDPLVDPNGDIPLTIEIPPEGAIELRVPTVRNANGEPHGRPYVMYSIEPPQGTLTVLEPDGHLPLDGPEVPDAVARRTEIPVLTGDTATIELQIDQDGTQEDNAVIRWNHGLDVDGDDSGAFGIAHGVDDPLLAGFENFTTHSSPSSQPGGTGTYRLEVDLTNPDIPEGYNYITAMAFVPRLSGLPPIFNTFRKVVYVDRRGPDLDVVFPPTQTGNNDILWDSYGFVIENPDGTGNSLHYFWNLPQAVTDPYQEGLLSGANHASWTDRNRWRFSLHGLEEGNNQRLTLVIFEETGNYTVEDFSIGVSPDGPIPPDGPADAFAIF